MRRVPRSHFVEGLESRVMLAVAPGLVPVGTQPAGTLSGKIVFTSGGHGWQYNTTLGRYATDRGDSLEVEEAFGNQDQMTYYADYLLRGGATVVPMRPVGRQLNQVVLDNDSAGVTYTGTWSNSTGTQYYDEDYGNGADSVSYRFSSTTSGTETALATYTPTIPQAGMYPVYTWVARGNNRTTQLYRINHTGGATEIRVDHRAVGFGWVYLGTYHFNSGSDAEIGSVEISNNSSVSGTIIADAIRFGNGMGDYVFTGSGATAVSGYPREDENSYHWIARMVGIGNSIASIAGTSSTSNVSAPSEMAEHMYNGPFGGAVYVGFHSNAGGGRGARGLIDSSSPTPNQDGTNGLADILGDQINQDFQAQNGVFEYNWTTGTTSTFTSGFGEINLGAGAEMDATIIEVAFHDSVEDAAILRDPKGRDQIARSVYQGTVQYFSLYGSPTGTNTNLPSPPTTVRAVSNASGQVTVNWTAGPSSPASVHGAAATGYRVYASIDGYGFDGGTSVSGGGTTSATLTGLDPTKVYYFRVAATNAGGESKPTEVVAALPTGGTKQVLIVNGFDRFDRTQNFRYDYLGQQVDRVWSRYNNSFDYINRVASAIAAAKPGVHIASTSNEAVINGAVNMTDYDSVVWISGVESTDDDTFNATEQTRISTFLAAGGNLFLSGAEIGWDLDQQNNGRTFYENTLKANYVSDDAGTYTAVVDGGGIFAGLSSLVFSSGAGSTVYSTRDDQVYNVTTPDVIAPQVGAISALTYSGGTGGTAAIQVAGASGAGNLVMFAFPFETMTNATRRQQVMGKILDFFGVAAPAPAVDVKTRVAGLDADTPTGPVVAAGGTVTFTYIVTNPGNVPLSGIVVTDNNGTSGNAADDFSPAFTGGDANGNSQLDVGEVWNYTANRTAVTGQFTNSGSVIAVGNAQNVSDSDPGNYFGSAPGIAIETRVNGLDADTPPGPTLNVGNNATFTYLVTNTGNAALNTLAVTDNNGTPANAADDFTPTFSGGDANSNSQLDLGETWSYTASRPVAAGQYSNSGSVTAKDSINQNVSANDPSNYVGIVPVSATPGTPDLDPGSDSGANSDNLTRFDNFSTGTLSFLVPNTIPGAVVKVYANGVEIGHATAAAATTATLVITEGTHDLIDSSPAHSITARQTESGKSESADSPALNISIDTAKPAPDIVDISPDPRTSAVGSMSISFTRPVSNFDLADLSLTRDNGSNLLTGAQTLTTSDNITFTLNNLTDLTDVTGAYELKLTEAGSGIVDSLVENPLAGDAIESWTHALPAWVMPGSSAVWKIGTQTLTITGAASVWQSPAGDSPHIVATGPTHSVQFNPSTGTGIEIASLTLSNGASATIASLGGARSASNHHVLVADAISIDASGKLDLTDNDLVVDYAESGPAPSIEADVRRAFNGGDWLGAGGIFSSIAREDPNFHLGVADNAGLSVPFGAAQSGPLFSGVNVDSSSMLVKFTHRVDLNLDGRVNDDDSILFSTNFESGSSAFWSIGDVSMDGIFSDDDSILFGTYFDSTLPPV